MARSASLHLIAFFPEPLADLLEEAIEDCKVVAESYLTGSFAISLEGYSDEPLKVDARKGIEDAAARVAAKKRNFCVPSLKGSPSQLKHVAVPRPNRHQCANKNGKHSQQRLSRLIKSSVWKREKVPRNDR